MRTCTLMHKKKVCLIFCYKLVILQLDFDKGGKRGIELIVNTQVEISWYDLELLIRYFSGEANRENILS